MESLEISAKTAEEAIQLALEQLSAKREEVEVVVLKEGRSGVLGLGGEEATVRVTLLESAHEKEDDIANTARGILEKLLAGMGVSASVTLHIAPGVEGEAAPPITLDIEGDDLGILIGRRGQTLACLQYVVRLIVSHQTKRALPIIIDVENYRQRRYEALQNLARRIAEQVRDNDMPFALEPMPAYERRIMHITLVDHPKVTTRSIGEGEGRKVIIEPKGLHSMR